MDRNSYHQVRKRKDKGNDQRGRAERDNHV